MIRRLIQSQPLWLRKFEQDTLLGFVPSVLVMSAITANEAGVNALVAALGFAAMKSAQRNLGEWIKWTEDLFGTK